MLPGLSDLCPLSDAAAALSQSGPGEWRTCHRKHAAHHSAHPDKEVRKGCPGLCDGYRYGRQVVYEEHRGHLHLPPVHHSVVLCHRVLVRLCSLSCTHRFTLSKQRYTSCSHVNCEEVHACASINKLTGCNHRSHGMQGRKTNLAGCHS